MRKTIEKIYEYRVIVHGAKKFGLQSWFFKFDNDQDAKAAAIDYGLKLLGDSVEVAKKCNHCFNHYCTFDVIDL